MATQIHSQYDHLVRDFLSKCLVDLDEENKLLKEDLYAVAATPMGSELLNRLSEKVHLVGGKVILQMNQGEQRLGWFSTLGDWRFRIEVHEKADRFSYFYQKNDLRHLARFSRPQILVHELLHLNDILQGISEPFGKGVPSDPKFTTSSEELVITGFYQGRKVTHLCERSFNLQMGQPQRDCHGFMKTEKIDPNLVRLEQVALSGKLEQFKAYLAMELYGSIFEKNLGVIFKKAALNFDSRVALFIIQSPIFDGIQYQELMGLWFFNALFVEPQEVLERLFALPVCAVFCDSIYTEQFFENARAHKDISVANFILRQPWIDQAQLEECIEEEFSRQLEEVNIEELKQLCQLEVAKILLDGEYAMKCFLTILWHCEAEFLHWCLSIFALDPVKTSEIVNEYWSYEVELIELEHTPVSVEKMHTLVELGADLSLIAAEGIDYLLGIDPGYGALFEPPSKKRVRVC
ncbi:MAG: hypothetical protein MRY21_04395 [Simkaniaceae bacterium]|nr:hypothetical protein [Simkaniaceae bacterium]